ncbi:hypothetical protein ECIV_ORF24 [European chub iridovirus]|nr:hypothetical protein ECIV_ORF24 [European chub iridovirus]
MMFYMSFIMVMTISSYLIVSARDVYIPSVTAKIVNRTHVALTCTVVNSSISNNSGLHLLWIDIDNNHTLNANDRKYIDLETFLHDKTRVACCLAHMGSCVASFGYVKNVKTRFFTSNYTSMQWVQGNRPDTYIPFHCFDSRHVDWYVGDATWANNETFEMNRDNLLYVKLNDSNECIMLINHLLGLKMSLNCANDKVFMAMAYNNRGEIRHKCFIWVHFEMAKNITGVVQCGGVRGILCRIKCTYVLNKQIEVDDVIPTYNDDGQFLKRDMCYLNDGNRYTCMTYSQQITEDSVTCKIKAKNKHFVQSMNRPIRLCKYAKSVTLVTPNNCNTWSGSCKYICMGNGTNCGVSVDKNATISVMTDYTSNGHMSQSRDNPNLVTFYLAYQTGPVTLKCAYDDFSISQTLFAPSPPFKGIEVFRKDKHRMCCRGKNVLANVDGILCNSRRGFSEVCCYTNTTISCETSYKDDV